VPPPVPEPSPLTRFFWEGVDRRELRIQRCRHCGRYIHYPRPYCRFCGSADLGGDRVSGRGTLYSWSVAMQAFHPFFADRVPYTLAVVELAEQGGLLFMSQVVGCREDALSVGLPVEVTFEELAPGLVLPMFRPER
jgi:uncharacterized OB-fold protein